MKLLSLYRFSLGLALATLLSACQTLEQQSVSPLPDNFHQVSHDLFRSAQPDALQMQHLAQQGFATVVNLRYWHTDDDEASLTSLKLVHIPMDAAQINDEQMIAALRAIHQSPKPVLVHCWHGSDRTGITVAMYRLVFENAKKEDVIAELRTPEFGYHEAFYPKIVDYILAVDVDAIRRQVLAN